MQIVLKLIFFQFSQSGTYSVIHRALILSVCNFFTCCLEARDRNQTTEEQNTIEKTVIKRRRQFGVMEEADQRILLSADKSANVTGEPEKNCLVYCTAHYLIYRQNTER